MHRRGLRQGDPLSPLLFILAIEPLHRLFDLATVAGLLSPLRGRKARLRCSLYADDAAVFLNPVRAEMAHVHAILQNFGAVSGLHVNLAKSTVYGIRCQDLDLADIVAPLQAATGTFPCRYLGLPLSFRRPRRVDFQPLLDKLGSRLARWKLLLLSHAGRLALLRAVLDAFPTYLLTSFVPPPWLVKAIDKIRRAWLWAADISCSGGRCKVAWAKVCRPRDLGGLGVLDLTKFSRALRLRWLWLEKTQPGRPWGGLPVPCDDTDRELFAAATSVTLGDGASASFWHDSWLFGTAPKALAPQLYKLSRRKHRVVRDALRDGAWIRDLRGRVSPDLLDLFVTFRSLLGLAELSPEVRDTFTWRFSADGGYSTASAYRLQFLGAMDSPLIPIIWKPWAAPRCRFFAWLVVQNRLMTADRLLARRWPNNYFCPLCMRSLETCMHLFVECPHARRIWERVAVLASAHSLDPATWGTPARTIDWLGGLSAGLPAAEASRVHSWSLLVLWQIWLERNARIFRQASSSVATTMAKINDEAAAWDLAGAKIFPPRE
jgi:hypothetical protein